MLTGENYIKRTLLSDYRKQNRGGKGKRGTLLSVDPDTLHIISIDLSQPHLIQGEAANLLGEPSPLLIIQR